MVVCVPLQLMKIVYATRLMIIQVPASQFVKNLNMKKVRNVCALLEKTGVLHVKLVYVSLLMIQQAVDVLQHYLVPMMHTLNNSVLMILKLISMQNSEHVKKEMKMKQIRTHVNAHQYSIHKVASAHLMIRLQHIHKLDVQMTWHMTHLMIAVKKLGKAKQDVGVFQDLHQQDAIVHYHQQVLQILIILKLFV